MDKRREKTKEPADYKLRTRAHIISDLSVNSVERFFLLEGHACSRPGPDYGYDLQVFTFENGAFENGFVLLQLKATEAISLVENDTAVSFPITRADLNLWSGEIYPVILVVWDANVDVGYWLYLQEYLAASLDYPLPAGKAELSIRLPTANIMDAAAVEKIRQHKNAVLKAYRT